MAYHSIFRFNLSCVMLFLYFFPITELSAQENQKPQKKNTFVICEKMEIYRPSDNTIAIKKFLCGSGLLENEHRAKESKKELNIRDARPIIIAFESDYFREGVSITIRHPRRVSRNFNLKSSRAGILGGTIHKLSDLTELACFEGMSRNNFRKITGSDQYKGVKAWPESLQGYKVDQVDQLPAAFVGDDNPLSILAYFRDDRMAAIRFSCGF
jgi:hypothetical protein